jgi:hypothetical protein
MIGPEEGQGVDYSKPEKEATALAGKGRGEEEGYDMRKKRSAPPKEGQEQTGTHLDAGGRVFKQCCLNYGSM